MNQINKERTAIANMFNSIAKRYDLLNFILSFGIDSRWRKKTIKYILAKRPDTLLDIACGTGDLTIDFAKRGIKCVGLDISEKMMAHARVKSQAIICSEKSQEFKAPSFIKASAEDLPFSDKKFSAATIAFGIRNFERRDVALKEIHRVLAVGGRLAILEFAKPRNILWRLIYLGYLNIYVPIVGRIFSKNRFAYKYLASSIESFPKYEEFLRELEYAGFSNCKYKSLSGGIALLYTCEKS